MKNIIKKLTFILLFIPIFINARVNYEDAVKYANNFIYGIEDYRDYIYLNERIPYSLENTGNEINNDFKSGGFLSRREYEISNFKGRSYLSNGLQYWTLTKSSYLKHYIIDYKLAEEFDQNLSGVKVTEYIKPTTSVSGTGSYSNPWVFKDMYSIYISSNLESTGMISETDCSNAKGSIHISLIEGESRPIAICPATGYRKLKTSCDKYIKPILGSNTSHMVSELDKDNIVCKVTFAYITKGLTLDTCSVQDANGGVHTCNPAVASPNKFYINPNTGFFFKDEDAQYPFAENEKITNLPSLTGYTFEGYYTGQNGTGTRVVEPDGTLKKGLSIGAGMQLSPSMRAKTFKITFNANGGIELSKSEYTVTYNQKYGANGGLATVKKAGSKFLGWYTSTSGGSKINNEDLVKITSNTTLYARWETCPAGTKSDGVNCTTCPAGTSAAAGSSECTACPAGTKSSSGAGSCTACPAGQYNTGTGNTTCTKCAAGRYNTGTGNTTCTACPAGKYNTGTGNTSCTACPAGQYNSGTGNTSCKQCGAGTYSASGATSCTACAAGSYSAAGASTCTACPAGKYNTGTGNTSCTACPAGKYNTGTGNTSCTACAAGKYNTGTGNTSCSNCPAGKYNTGTGNTQCLDCTAGTYSSTGASSCTACPAGQYSGTGASSCTQCPAGKYSSGTGSASCTNCPAGSYTSTTGNNKCTACAAGKYNTGTGNTSCTNCAAGSYNTGTGNTTCTTCPPGQYNTGTGNTSCKQCEAGYYCTGGPNRKQCPSGYTSNAGSDASSDCYVAYKCSKGTLTEHATYGWICTYGPSYGYVGQEWDSCADWGPVDYVCDSCADYGITGYTTVSCGSGCSGCNDGICGPPNDGCWGGSSGKAYCSCPKFGCQEECWYENGCIGGYVDVQGYYCPDKTLSGSGSSMTCYSKATQ